MPKYSWALRLALWSMSKRIIDLSNCSISVSVSCHMVAQLKISSIKSFSSAQIKKINKYKLKHQSSSN
ncbi:hypothetical protein BpHYR1_020040 [Brachionus plicatilis]|uniref:Uncharacterized protein n=1 Tax=Brachionus plicatilis TaxID=10195 RepID=A0A3M7PHD0_BRAPC|nr:hypothetical protein BpHYR1_020040 [Brachionus plicatilis]